MADNRPQFEQEDRQGTTTLFAGTVGTTAVLIPSSPGAEITEILVRSPLQTPSTKILSWSLDNVVYHELGSGEFFGWHIKGSVTQIYIKGSVASVEYEITMNRDL
jgi:hypothetical protein